MLPAQSPGQSERAKKHRRIPGNDGADHADRLASRVAQDMFAQRNRFTLELARKPTEIAQDVGRAFRLGSSLRADRVAGFLSDDARELFDPRLDHICDLLQQAAAFARDDTTPARAGVARGLHRPVDIFRAAAWDGGDDLAQLPGDSTDISRPPALSVHSPSISICARRPMLAGFALLIATAIAAASLRASSRSQD